jgi:hypothetical protein
MFVRVEYDLQLLRGTNLCAIMAQAMENSGTRILKPTQGEKSRHTQSVSTVERIILQRMADLANKSWIPN